MLAKVLKKISRENLGILTVLILAVAVCVISVRINIFRYNNYDFGKFDLGNMVQMVWNTLHGRFMYLTDYFGGSVPRWSMSHVDPILILFAPLFALFPHPLTLVFAQLFLTTIVSSVLIFKISKMNLNSNLASTLIALAYLFYPALGYLNTQTGFHGVSAAIPFFLMTVFMVEKMYYTKNYSSKNFLLLWIFSIVTMSGKEQLALYIIFLSLYALFFRIPKPDKGYKELVKSFAAKNLLALFAVSTLWLVLAFYVIIPNNTHYRVDSYSNFTKEVGIDAELTSEVTQSNYFLSRYEDLGDSYGEIVLGIITKPARFIRIIFGGDKLDNFNRTFAPTAFLPFLAPQMLLTALPDLVINYSTTSGGIGTSEISNHRISMIIPVIFLSTILAISTISKHLALAYKKILERFFHKTNPSTKKFTLAFVYFLASGVLTLNIFTSFKYNNPVYLWFTQAVSKRLASVAYAKFDREVGLKENLKLGDRFRISGLENKDRECAQKIIGMIPPSASVSGPDYLGAHLAQRETYAIFPALYSKADYVIVDVFSQKIMRILDTDVSLVRDVVGDMIVNTNYKNVAGCGNLFVFKKTPNENASQKLPMQERFKYPTDMNLEIFEGLFLADFKLPESVVREEPAKATFVFVKKSNKLDDYVIFTSYINSRTGEIFQAANIPSYGLFNLGDWREDRYYIEENVVTIPSTVDSGLYHAFVGITNNVRTRSIYLADVEVR